MIVNCDGARVLASKNSTDANGKKVLKVGLLFVALYAPPAGLFGHVASKVLG